MLKRFFQAFVVLLLVSCGSSQDNTITPPSNPTAPADPSTPPSTTTTPPTSNLPAWAANEVPIQYPNGLDFHVFENFLMADNKIIVPPVVGDAYVAMEFKIADISAITVNGNLDLAIEDASGFKWETIPSVYENVCTGTNQPTASCALSQKSSSSFNAYFQNSVWVIHVYGTIDNTDTLSAKIDYRARASSDTVGTLAGEGACETVETFYGSQMVSQEIDNNFCADYMKAASCTAGSPCPIVSLGQFVTGNGQASFQSWFQ